MASSVITMSNLLPDPDAYILAYSVPLLLTSFVATFAGTFLTLDRTRSFSPVDLPRLSTQHTIYRLEGGMGGLMAGWLCGLHLSTFLTLLVLNTSTLKTPSAIQFLVIWVMSSNVLMLLGGRWRTAACVFYALIGGSAISSLLIIVFLPSALTPRYILFAIFSAILLVASLIPVARIQHIALRICTSLSGAFGLVISISLFAKIKSWSNPWLVFIVEDYVGSIDSKQKGLSATLCAFALAGAAVDWALQRWIGEDPDKEWDAYLAKYARTLPNDANRAGSFKPFESVWSKLFHGRIPNGDRDSKDMLFPPDSQLLPTSSISGKGAIAPPPSFRPYTKRRATLSKAKLKSRANAASSSSDDSDTDNDGPPKFKPWLIKRTSTGVSAATTVVANDTPKITSPLARTNEDYSDVEGDLSVEPRNADKERDSPGWKPGFLRKYEEEAQRSSSSPTITRQGTQQTLRPEELPPPTTPSLIKAYDRIQRAQAETSISSPRTPQPQTSNSPELDAGFWNALKSKAGEVRFPMPQRDQNALPPV